MVCHETAFLQRSLTGGSVSEGLTPGNSGSGTRPLPRLNPATDLTNSTPESRLHGNRIRIPDIRNENHSAIRPSTRPRDKCEKDGLTAGNGGNIAQ